jgi:hypothetical protein
MTIKPILAFRHVNFPADTALNPDRTYYAEHATNQPDWTAKGLIFVDSIGAPEHLLETGEYIVVDPETEHLHPALH